MIDDIKTIDIQTSECVTISVRHMININRFNLPFK